MSDVQHTQGMKFDDQKIQMDLLLDFSRAFLEIGKVATYGANKYAPGNWQFVVDAERRYTAAMLRHLLEAQTENCDKETNLQHFAHFAWNVLAVLELKLRAIDTKVQD